MLKIKDNIDKELEKLGLKKVKENGFVITYERKGSKFNYIQVIEIVHKSNKDNIVSSYQKKINKDGFNNSVGITFKEIKLLNKKIKQLQKNACGNRKVGE